MKRKCNLFITIMLVFALVLSSIMPINAAVKSKAVTLKSGKTVTAYVIKGSQTVKFSISGTSYKWSSSKTKVATVSKKGIVTIKKAGTANIVAQKGKNKYTCKLVVESPKISKTKATLYQGKTVTLKVSGTKQKVTWKSSNTKVATVSNKGVVVGRTEGTTVIYATVGNAKTYKCSVTVKKVASVTPTPKPTATPTPRLTATPKPTATPRPTATPTPTPKPSYIYQEGQYRVGTDIPAGEYVFFASNDKYSGYYCESSDANGNNIINNENFDYNDIYTITSGNYLKMSRCYAIPLSKNPHVDTSGSGTFIVGKHIPAGTYKVQNTEPRLHGYYCIYPDTYHKKIIANDLFENTAYVTVENGQVLLLSRAKIIN